jgi:hypothetical protein
VWRKAGVKSGGRPVDLSKTLPPHYICKMSDILHLNASVA